MKRGILIYALLSILLFNACEKSNDTDSLNNKLSDTLLIKTSKTTYNAGENVIVELTNYYNSTADYYVCSSYKGIPPSVLKKENIEWKGFWSPVCNGHTSFCCLGLLSGNSRTDTMGIAFEEGKYKLKYSFIPEPGKGYQDYFSNEFSID